MLDQAEISFSLGTMLSWLGMTVATVLLAVNLIYYQPGLVGVGLGVMMLTCTHTIRRAIFAHERTMREAFELGRDHERSRHEKVRAVR